MSGRILMIEDEPSVSLTVSDLLTGEGYEVDVAADGPSGLARATNGRYDVILLDLMLPGLDGLELCRGLNDMFVTRHDYLPIHLRKRRGALELWRCESMDL